MELGTIANTRSSPIVDLVDCSSLITVTQQLPIFIRYERIVDPDKNELPYFIAFAKFGLQNSWFLLSTKLSERYEPVLVDEIVNLFVKEGITFDLQECLVTLSASEISVLLSSNEVVTIDDTNIVRSWIVQNSYNGTGTTIITSGYKNQDSNYFMPRFSKSVTIRHNKVDQQLKRSISSIVKTGHNQSMVDGIVNFIRTTKQKIAPDNNMVLFELGVVPESKTDTLYNLYTNKVLSFLTSAYTPKVLLQKVSVLEKELIKV